MKNISKFIKLFAGVLIGLAIVYPAAKSSIDYSNSYEAALEVKDGNPNRVYELFGVSKMSNGYGTEGTDYTSGLEYTVNDVDSTCSVSHGSYTGGTDSYLTIPDYYIDTTTNTTYTVTSIANNGFNGIDFVSIDFPSTLTTIGYQAFQNNNTIVTISLPSGVGPIYPGTFENCKHLTYFGFEGGGANCTRIYDHAFAGCDYLSYDYDPDNPSVIRNFEFPSGLTQVDASAFAYCISLKNILIPSGTTTIQENAFYMCTNVILIHLPTSVVNVSEYAFRGISSAKAYLSAASTPSTFTTDWNRISNKSGETTDSSAYIQVYYNIESIDNDGDYIYIVEDNKAKILEYIGDGDLATKVVQVPATLGTADYPVVEILEEAFYNNIYKTTITSIDLSLCTSLTKIGKQAFAGMTGVKTLTLNEGLLEVGVSSFNTMQNVSTLTIPSTVTTIGEGAFENFHRCFAITFAGNNVTSIGKNAFHACGNWTYAATDAYTGVLELPYSLRNGTMVQNAFDDCDFIQEITFREDASGSGSTSTLALPQTCFTGCDELCKINWADWVSEIGNNCFASCGNLPYLYIPETVTTIGQNIVNNAPNCTIYIEGPKLSTMNDNLENQGASNNSNSGFPQSKNGVYYNIGAETNILSEPVTTTNTYYGYYYILDDNTHSEDVKHGQSTAETTTHITITGFIRDIDHLNLTKNTTAELKIKESYTISGTTYNVTEIGQAAFAGFNKNTSNDSTKCIVHLPNTVKYFDYSCFFACKGVIEITGYTGSTNNTQYCLPTALTYLDEKSLHSAGCVNVYIPIAVNTYVPSYYKNVADTGYNETGGSPNTGTSARLDVCNFMYKCESFVLYTPTTAGAVFSGTVPATSTTQTGTNLTSYESCLYINSARNLGSTTGGGTLLFAIPYKLTTLKTYSGCNITGMDLVKNGNITSANLNYGITKMYGWIFDESSDPKNLTSVTLPTTLKYISNSAFLKCQNLTNFDVNTSATDTTDVPTNTFDLSAFTALKQISDSAFRNCDGIKKLILPTSENLDLGSNCFSEIDFTNGAAGNEGIYVTDTYANFNKYHIYHDADGNPKDKGSGGIAPTGRTWTSGAWNLNSETKVYYYLEDKPTTLPTGHYVWRYVSGVPTIWTEADLA